MKYWKTY